MTAGARFRKHHNQNKTMNTIPIKPEQISSMVRELHEAQQFARDQENLRMSVEIRCAELAETVKRQEETILAILHREAVIHIKYQSLESRYRKNATRRTKRKATLSEKLIKNLKRHRNRRKS
jgi:hypothetical protein